MKKTAILTLPLLFVCSAYAQREPTATAAKPISLVIHLDAGKKKLPVISGSDLNVLDNGSKITTPLGLVPGAERKLSFAIVLDASGSMRDKVPFLQKAVLQIFDEAAKAPSSRGLFYTFGRNIQGGNSWTDRAEVEGLLQKYRVEQGNPSPLFATIATAADRLAELDAEQGSPRRLIFAISDGVDTSPGADEREALEACMKGHVTVIPIALLAFDSVKLGKSTANRLADETGGRAIILDSPADMSRLISEILTSEFVLTFSPATSGPEHTILVDMPSAPKGVQVKAPRKFYQR